MVREPNRKRQKNRRILFLVGIGIAVLIGLCIGTTRFIYFAYMFRWTWTGFYASGGPNVQQYQPMKTLWDWMQLLIVPVALAITAFFLNHASKLNEQHIAFQRDQTEHEIATDNQQEKLLQDYLDRMAELLLAHRLRETDSSTETRYIARARTLTVLSRLDSERKGSLLRFLYESDLIGTEHAENIIDLSDANLKKANLSRIKLRGANLNKADLSGATFRYANLDNASLNETNLSEANLMCAHLSGASLRRAKLGGATLNMANLTRAYLNEADLKQADLAYAIFNRADLTGADLRGADIEEVDFDHAICTEEQIEKAKSRTNGIVASSA